MKRRSLLAMLGLAPVAAVAKPIEEASQFPIIGVDLGAGDDQTVMRYAVPADDGLVEVTISVDPFAANIKTPRDRAEVQRHMDELLVLALEPIRKWSAKQAVNG